MTTLHPAIANPTGRHNGPHLSRLDAVRPSSKIKPRTCRKTRYNSRSNTAVIMPDCRRAPTTTGQRSAACAEFWNPTRHPHAPLPGSPSRPCRNPWTRPTRDWTAAVHRLDMRVSVGHSNQVVRPHADAAPPHADAALSTRRLRADSHHKGRLRHLLHLLRHRCDSPL